MPDVEPNDQKSASDRIEPTPDMSADQLMVTFISNAVGKIQNKDQVMKQLSELKIKKPIRRPKYVPATNGTKSDFEVLQLPKVKFIRDHNDRLISSKGEIIGEYSTPLPPDLLKRQSDELTSLKKSSKLGVD